MLDSEINVYLGTRGDRYGGTEMVFGRDESPVPVKANRKRSIGRKHQIELQDREELERERAKDERLRRHKEKLKAKARNQLNVKPYVQP